MIEVVEIGGDVDTERLPRQLWFVFLGRGQRVPVSCPAVKVYIHVASVALGNLSGIDPRGGGNLIPHNVSARSDHGEASDVVSQGCSARLDLPGECRRQMGFN